MSHVDEAQLTAYLDQQLEYADPEHRRELGRHIADCRQCMVLLKEVRTNRDRATEIVAASAPPEAPAPSFDAITQRAEGIGPREVEQSSAPADEGFDLSIPMADAPIVESAIGEPVADSSTGGTDDFELSIPTVDDTAAAPATSDDDFEISIPTVDDTSATPTASDDNFEISIPTVDDPPATPAASDDSFEISIPTVDDKPTAPAARDDDFEISIPTVDDPPIAPAASDDDFEISIPTIDEPETVLSESAAPSAGDELNISIPTPAKPVAEFPAETVNLGDDLNITVPTTEDEIAIPSESDSPSGEWDLSGAVAAADDATLDQSPEITIPTMEETEPAVEEPVPVVSEDPPPQVTAPRPSLMIDMGLITSDAITITPPPPGFGDGAEVDTPLIDDAAGPDLGTTEGERADFEEAVPDLAVGHEPAAATGAGGLTFESTTDWDSSSEPPAAPPAPLELESASLDTPNPYEPPAPTPPLDSSATTDPEMPALQFESTNMAGAGPAEPEIPALEIEATSHQETDRPADPVTPSMEFETPGGQTASEEIAPPPPVPSLELESVEVANEPTAPPPPPPPPVDTSFDVAASSGLGNDADLADVPDLAGLSLQDASDMASTESAPPPVDDLGFGDLAPGSASAPPPVDQPPVRKEPPRPPTRPSLGSEFDQPRLKPTPAVAAPTGGSKSWMAIAASVLIMVGGGGAAWWYGVIPGVPAGNGSSPATVASAPEPTQPLAANIPAPAPAAEVVPDQDIEAPVLDSLGETEQDFLASASGPTVLGLADTPAPTDETTGGSASEALARQVDSAAQVAETLDAEAIAAQVAPPAAPSLAAAAPPSQKPAERLEIPQAVAAERSRSGGIASGLSMASAGAILSGPMVMIQGLTIDNISRFNSDGRDGVRMIQVDNDGNRITVEVIPSGIPGEPQPTDITVEEVAGGAGSSGTARWGAYDVSAFGTLGIEELRSYLRRLVQAAGTD